MGKKPLDLNWNEILPGCHVGPFRPSELRALTDADLQDRIKRLSINLKLPDGGEKLRPMRRQLEEERDRRNTARIQKGIKDYAKPMETTVEALSEGFGPSDSSTISDEILDTEAGAAFSEELKHVMSDKYKNSAREKRFPEEKIETRSSSRLTRRSSKELPSASNPKKDERSFLSSQRMDVCSSSISHAGRNLSRRLSKRRKAHPYQDSIYSKFEKKKAQHVVLLEDEDVQSIHSIEDDEIPDEREFKLYYPSSDDPNCVELSYSDIKCLDPGMYLSSPIMNFYIQYLQKSLSSIDKRVDDCYIFNTYFYSKLEEAVTCKGDKSTSFMKLRRWWKGIDIFQKAYILLPIHRENHWSLAIICIPGKKDETGIIVLHMDSLTLHRTSNIFYVISSYLKEEWTYMNENALPLELPISEKIWKNLPRMIEKKKITVPEQPNDYDCGLFVLYFIERFILEAPERLRKTDLTMFGSKWFKPEEASSLRQRIQDLLLEEFNSRFTGKAEEVSGSSEDE